MADGTGQFPDLSAFRWSQGLDQQGKRAMQLVLVATGGDAHVFPAALRTDPSPLDPSGPRVLTTRMQGRGTKPARFSLSPADCAPWRLGGRCLQKGPS